MRTNINLENLKKLLLSLLPLMILFIPQASFASAGGEHHSAGLSSLIFPVINFSIYFAVIVFLIKKFAPSFFKGRALSLREQIQRVGVELAGVSQEIDTIKERLSEVEKEKEFIVQEFANDADLVASDIVAKAEAMAVSIKNDAKLRIQGERRSFERELGAKLLDDAVSKAIDELSKIDDSKDKELRANFVRNLVSEVN